VDDDLYLREDLAEVVEHAYRLSVENNIEFEKAMCRVPIYWMMHELYD
jgi:hypothetical protein